MRYDWLVDAILTLHFGFLAFLVLGGFLAWRWPRMIVAHLAAAGWAVLIVLAWVDCPLTIAEKWARARNSEAVPEAGFIDRYVTGVIYPADYVDEARLGVAAVVLVSWVGFVVLRRRRRRAASADTQARDARPGGGAVTV